MGNSFDLNTDANMDIYYLYIPEKSWNIIAPKNEQKKVFEFWIGSAYRVNHEDR